MTKAKAIDNILHTRKYPTEILKSAVNKILDIGILCQLGFLMPISSLAVEGYIGYHWLLLVTIDLVVDNRELEV